MNIKHLSLVSMIIIGTSVFAQDYEPSKIKATLTREKTFSQFDGAGNDFYEVLQLKHISASSDSYQGNGNYVPSNLIDNNNTTAWVANQRYLDYPQRAAKGSTVFFNFSDNDEPILLEIVPGYLKSDKTWNENTRIKKIRITYLNELKDMKEPIIDVVVDLKLNNGKLPMKSQYVNLMPFYVHNMAMTDFSVVRIEILDTENGAKYQDACISTINFYKKGDLIKK